MACCVLSSCGRLRGVEEFGGWIHAPTAAASDRFTYARFDAGVHVIVSHVVFIIWTQCVYTKRESGLSVLLIWRFAGFLRRGDTPDRYAPSYFPCSCFLGFIVTSSALFSFFR